MIRMFLNQFAISVFGFVLAMAATQAQNVVLRNITSVFSILFYMFLLYTMTWEMGFKDKANVDNGYQKRQPLMGLYISLCANIPNFLFALFISLATWFNVKFFSTLGGISAFCARILEGMYLGVLANPVNSESQVFDYWWAYFLIIIPSLLTCTVAYYFGLKDRKFTKLFKYQYPESDREPKRKKRRNDGEE